jgi:murein DD-endopeptidase MepM/ murein hydrolase activator NlpD
MPTLPLPILPDGRAPVISSGFGPRKMPGGKMVQHDGADITYRAMPNDPPPKMVNGKVVYSADRTKGFYSPAGLPVLATEAGEVVQAAKKPGIGGDVWLHHKESGRVTRYAHLSSIAVKLGDQVREGQKLGTWGAGHGTPFVHLHFELLTAGKKNSQEDPTAYLAGANVGPTVRVSQGPGRIVGAKSTSAGQGGFGWLLLLLIGALASTKS